MKRNNLFSFVLLSSSWIHAHPEPIKQIKLESKILKAADGKSYAIGAPEIKLNVQLLAQLHRMQYGIKSDDTHELVGIFTYKNSPHSIHSLAQRANENLNENFDEIVQEIKQYFCKIVKPFLKNSEGKRDIILPLIEEECEKRNIPNSFLLTWSQYEDERALEVFDSEMRSINDLDTFLTDLRHFLTDLLHSCPKAVEQYREEKKANRLKIKTR